MINETVGTTTTGYSNHAVKTTTTNVVNPQYPSFTGPGNDLLCAGCGKPVNVIVSRNEKGVYHGPECFNKINPPQ